ncbi:MAG: hypothetical protein AVDCRST_MAG01-01-2709 [uncultured Rubrobacteraceae bacterium]|uniref:Uncharacterized protein n=1 Tax=uncultured Rubrobacteraceae bacterium TaxID=349277 RepID=A0A6J4Q163_9ACTN|nr:MAG: hypothetical protein AVDCRST_MAG01-01-2709 [uncultured Rubrobacteraceae bacterium]
MAAVPPLGCSMHRDPSDVSALRFGTYSLYTDLNYFRDWWGGLYFASWPSSCGEAGEGLG